MKLKSSHKKENNTLQSDQGKIQKQIIEIVIVAVVLGLLILIYDFVNNRINFDGTFDRKSAGQGDTTQVVELQYDDSKEDISVSISDQILTEEQVEKYFDEAIDELESTYLGENKSANDVRRDLVLKKTYVDGLISAQWKFDKYGIVSQDGVINEDNISEDGDIVSATVILSYEEYERVYGFSFVVNPLGTDTKEGQLLAINKAIATEDENTRDKPTFTLPDTVENMSLNWKKKMDYRGLQIMLLGIAAAVAMVVSQKRDKEKARELIIKERENDYPMIVSELSILMGAGMSFRKAIERIVIRYVAKVKKDPTLKSAGYDDIVLTHRRMQEGVGELAAIEELGKSSESKDYRKLSTMLIQNLRKGSRDLIDCLEKEEENAFEARKQRAIRAGEEASTKLLLPMGGMLLIIIVILIVPAMLQMKG